MQRFISTVMLASALTTGSTQLFAQATDEGSRQACEQLAQGSRMTDTGRAAVQELLKSGRAPEVMDKLLQVAKAMGNGDTLAGLERVTQTAEKLGGLLGAPKL